MSSSNTNQASMPTAIVRLALVVIVACTFAACKKDDAAGPEATAVKADAATAEQQVDEASAALATLTPEQLREKARTAYAESKLYAPAGDNAMEYYLALREKVPGDAGVSSALTDLMPMVVIATEQSRDREDFAEAQRLYVLIDKANNQHPSLERLKRTIADAQADAAKRVEQAELSAEQETERQKQLAEERERQQQQQQQQAAQQLATQQATERAAEQRAAEQRAAEQRAAEQTAAQPAPAQQAPARPAQPATPPPSNELRAVSTPAPQYPPDAFRSQQSGEVEVEFTVNPDGSVSNARVVRSNPSRVFDRAALSAVRQWRFQPVGAPVTTRRSIAFNPGG